MRTITEDRDSVRMSKQYEGACARSSHGKQATRGGLLGQLCRVLTKRTKAILGDGLGSFCQNTAELVGVEKLHEIENISQQHHEGGQMAHGRLLGGSIRPQDSSMRMTTTLYIMAHEQRNDKHPVTT